MKQTGPQVHSYLKDAMDVCLILTQTELLILTPHTCTSPKWPRSSIKISTPQAFWVWPHNEEWCHPDHSCQNLLSIVKCDSFFFHPWMMDLMATCLNSNTTLTFKWISRLKPDGLANAICCVIPMTDAFMTEKNNNTKCVQYRHVLICQWWKMCQCCHLSQIISHWD